MTIARSAADVLRDHVVLEYEAIDRMYLNVYVPTLQTVGGMLGYLRVHRGQRFASTTAVAPMTEAFVHNIEQFVASEGVDLITFEFRTGLADLRRDETVVDCSRVVGTEVGSFLVLSSPSLSWTRGSWSTSACRHGP